MSEELQLSIKSFLKETNKMISIQSKEKKAKKEEKDYNESMSPELFYALMN